MIELPYPHKALWPNGRPHWAAKARETKKHRAWAYAATVAIAGPPWAYEHGYDEENRVKWSVTFYPKTRHAVDDDNARASLKAYQDGIAQGIGVDDKLFDAPTIHWGEPVKHGKVVVSVGEA